MYVVELGKHFHKVCATFQKLFLKYINSAMLLKLNFRKSTLDLSPRTAGLDLALFLNY